MVIVEGNLRHDFTFDPIVPLTLRVTLMRDTTSPYASFFCDVSLNGGVPIRPFFSAQQLDVLISADDEPVVSAVRNQWWLCSVSATFVE